jgi:hypothetical protein
METEYYCNPDIRPKILMPESYDFIEYYNFIEYYYKTFRAQEAFDGKPPVDLDEIYDPYVQDWNNNLNRTPRLGPVAKVKFLRRLFDINQNYMTQFHIEQRAHRDELRRRQANPEIRSLRDMIMESLVDNTNGVSEDTRNLIADRLLERLSAGTGSLQRRDDLR